MNEFHSKRIALANEMATVGAQLLEHTGTAAALAAIPNTKPEQYVVAGTLAMIAKVLPADSIPPLTAPEPLTDELPGEKQERIWTCKIGGMTGALPLGADGPMRDAIYDAFQRLTGADAQFCFSGWGGKLEEIERAVVESRLPVAPAPQQSEGSGNGIGTLDRWKGHEIMNDPSLDSVEFVKFGEAFDVAAKAAPSAPVQSVTEGMVESAIEAFNEFPCPMNGSVSRTGNREHMRAALEGALLATPVQAEQAQAEPVGEVIYFAGDHDLKEVAWKKGKLPPVGTKLYAAPALPAQAEQAAAVRAADLDAIRAAIDVLDAFGNLPDSMMHPGPWNGRKAEDKIKAAREALSNIRALAKEAAAQVPSNDTGALGDTGGEVE